MPALRLNRPAVTASAAVKTCCRTHYRHVSPAAAMAVHALSCPCQSAAWQAALQYHIFFPKELHDEVYPRVRQPLYSGSHLDCSCSAAALRYCCTSEGLTLSCQQVVTAGIVAHHRPGQRRAAHSDSVSTLGRGTSTPACLPDANSRPLLSQRRLLLPAVPLLPAVLLLSVSGATTSWSP
jgi:hypothetical protein